MQDFRRLMISATFKSELFKSFAFDLSTYIMHDIILRRISHKISTSEVSLFVPSPEIEGRNAVEYTG
jgi:Flp pilus assembly protein protease CpaA